MFRKILVILGFVVVCLLFSGYFYCAERYSAQQRALLRCNAIDVIVTNSHDRNFVSAAEVREIVRPSVEGMLVNDINADALEDYICSNSAISHAEAYVRNPSTLVLEVTQRNPVVRFQGPDGGFYCDLSGYVLPLAGGVTLDLPIVCGALPFKADTAKGGFPEDGRQWLAELIGLTETIRNNSYWSREIEQIWVEENGDVVLYTNSCNEKFIFGGLNNVNAKLSKMAGYYRTIRPQALQNGKKYTSVNLKYKDQIICK
ncbi:MAG: hypothetical protein J6X89_02335 [Bacteroidales bacterium]|nr:hypothetical protein [Bacteroidales bacterium]